jgi:predicted outer membrane repeat protein
MLKGTDVGFFKVSVEAKFELESIHLIQEFVAFPTDTVEAISLSCPSELVINNSTFDQLRGQRGGAILSNCANRQKSTIKISNSTFVRNRSKFDGGAIYAVNSILRIENSTFSSNTAGSRPLDLGNGGAIFVWSSSAFISKSTIYKNSSDDSQLSSIGSTIRIKDSLFIEDKFFSGGHFVTTPNCRFRSTVFSAQGTNFATDDSCSGFFEIEEWQANLLPLSLNSPGITPTHEIGPGSIATENAIDCKDSEGVTLAIDQRGVSRPQDSRCDVGAYEYNDNGRSGDPRSGDFDGIDGVNVIDLYLCYRLYLGQLSGTTSQRAACDIQGRVTRLGGPNVTISDICAIVKLVLPTLTVSQAHPIIADFLACFITAAQPSLPDAMEIQLAHSENVDSAIPNGLFVLGLLLGSVAVIRTRHAKSFLLLCILGVGLTLSSCAFLFSPGAIALLASTSNQFITVSVQNVPSGLATFGILDGGFTFNPHAIRINSIQGTNGFELLVWEVDDTNGKVILLADSIPSPVESGPILIMNIEINPGFDISQANIKWNRSKLQFGNQFFKLIKSGLFQTYP